MKKQLFYEKINSEHGRIMCHFLTASNFPVHFHNEIEVLVPINEKLQVTVNDVIYELEPEDIIIINNMEPHSIRPYSDNCMHFVLQFNPFRLFSGIDNMKNKICVSRKITRDSGDLYTALYKQITAVSDTFLQRPDTYTYSLRFTSQLGIFYAFIAENLEWETLNAAEAEKTYYNLMLLKKITEFIAAKYAEPLTLSDVSTVANLSNFHFCRFFKRMSGQTFVQYLTDLRLSHAEKLLRSDECKIIEIAEKSGFSSTKAFNQIFKKKYGITPTAYRQEHKGNEPKIAELIFPPRHYID